MSTVGSRAIVAAAEMQSRGLTASAIALTELFVHAPPAVTGMPLALPEEEDHSGGSTPGLSPVVADRALPHDDYNEAFALSLAVSLMHDRQLARCHSVAVRLKSPKGQFLAWYAWFLLGDKAAAPVIISVPDPSQALAPPRSEDSTSFPRRNTHLPAIEEALRRLFTGGSAKLYRGDAYLVWLFGIVERALGKKLDALTAFQDAVMQEPLFYAAWQDLASAIYQESQITAVSQQLSALASSDGLPRVPPFMITMFEALALQHLSRSEEAAPRWEQLLAVFGPQCAPVLSALAVLLFKMKQLETSRRVFEDVATADPLRLEGLDEQSDLLFLLSDKPALSTIAQRAYAIDPYRAETNYVLGNYYALMQRPAASIACFRRTVAVDPGNCNAWTLLGHEYVEVRNTAAAVEAYTTALRVDPRDYRAWYALGQIYERQQLFHYALHYFRHTTTIRPHDARMWSVVAGCLTQQGRHDESIACLERAASCEPPTSEHYLAIAVRIAEHHANAGHRERAAEWYRKVLSTASATDDQVISALIFVANNDIYDAQRLLNVPVRSPSFEPGFAPVGPQPDDAARLSAEMRTRKAMELVIAVEENLQALTKLATNVTAEGGPTFGQATGANSVEEQISAIRRELGTTMHYLDAVTGRNVAE